MWERAVSQLAFVAKELNPELFGLSERDAATEAPEEIGRFLEKINLKLKLSDFGVSEDELDALAGQCMVQCDNGNNTRVATLEEMEEILRSAY